MADLSLNNIFKKSIGPALVHAALKAAGASREEAHHIRQRAIAELERHDAPAGKKTAMLEVFDSILAGQSQEEASEAAQVDWDFVSKCERKYARNVEAARKKRRQREAAEYMAGWDISTSSLGFGAELEGPDGGEYTVKATNTPDGETLRVVETGGLSFAKAKAALVFLHPNKKVEDFRVEVEVERRADPAAKRAERQARVSAYGSDPNAIG